MYQRRYAMTALLNRPIRAGPPGRVRAEMVGKTAENLTNDVGGAGRVRAGPKLTDIGLDLAGSALLS